MSSHTGIPCLLLSIWSLVQNSGVRAKSTKGVLWQTLSGMRLLTFCAIFPVFFPQEYVAYSHTGRIIPAIWFRYDLSPITVKYTERRQPLYRFITSVSYPTLSFSLPLPAFRSSPEPFLSRGIEFLPRSVVMCWG